MSKWTEILSTDAERLKQIAVTFNINPLAIEDCQNRDQRPKLDDFETHQLLVWFMYFKGKIYELQFLISQDNLVMIPHEAAPEGKTWSEFLKISESHKDIWHLLYQAIDRVTDITWQELRQLFGKIDKIEQKLFEKEINPQALIKFKTQLNVIEHWVGHHSSVASQILNLSRPKDDLKWKFRDLQDHCERIDRSIELYRAQIASIIDLYWGLQANRTNNQMKKLSLIASVSVPLTFWASFWGMNFEAIPFKSQELFFIALCMMALSVGVTFWYLVHKGYWSD